MISKFEKRIWLQALCTYVKQRRLELGLTEEELAEKAHMNVNYIYGIEKCIRDPSYTIMIGLAQALQIDIVKLISKLKSNQIKIFKQIMDNKK